MIAMLVRLKIIFVQQDIRQILIQIFKRYSIINRQVLVIVSFIALLCAIDIVK